MLAYHLFIAWKGIRRTPKHSLLIVLGIALGVAVATLFSAIHHTYAKDPFPDKSSRLYYVRMDNWDPQVAHPDTGTIPPLMSYADMLGIMKSNIPVRQSASFQSHLRISASAGNGPIRTDYARICHADFFTMFNLPFRYGSGWSREADEKAEPVVVLDDFLNERFFHGENSVGRTVHIEDRDFRVVGVLSPFRPPIRYYDFIAEAAVLAPERIFLSMSHRLPLGIWTTAAAMGWASPNPGIQEYNFLTMWVELAGPSEVAAYRGFLDAYSMDQRRLGRFQRPLDNRVTPLLEFMREQKLPAPEVTAMMITANLFLLACALSLTGLLLSSFLARRTDISVRRALGARRMDIFLHHIIEAELMALVGGLFGLALAAVSLWVVNGWAKRHIAGNRDDLFQLDPTMVWFALAASVLAGLIASIYPALRVCRVAPASYLKIQ